MSRYSAPTIDHPMRSLRRWFLSRRSRFAHCSVLLLCTIFQRCQGLAAGRTKPRPRIHHTSDSRRLPSLELQQAPKCPWAHALQPVPFSLTIGALNGLLSEQRFEDDRVFFAETREKNPWIDRCSSNWQSLAHLCKQGAGLVIPVDFAGSPQVRQCRQ